MRGHWKSGGGFPPPLFLLETGVSSLCPVPSLDSIRKSGSWGGNWRHPGEQVALRRLGELVPGLPPAWHLNPRAPLRAWRSVSCSLTKLRCLQFAPAWVLWLFSPALAAAGENWTESAPHPRPSFAAPPAGEPVSPGELEFSLWKGNPFSLIVCVSHSVVSDSLRPHELYPARLLCPWNSPGKNTGVDCHSLLRRIFLTQGLEPWSPASQAESLPLELQGSPAVQLS